MAKIDKETFLSMGYLQNYVERITKRCGSSWVCPLCGSGTGPKRTGAFNIRKDPASGVDRWRCFSCGKGGDLFDLIGEVENVQGYPKQLEKAKEIFGVDVFSTGQPVYMKQPPRMEEKKKDAHTHTYTCVYTQFFEEANRHLQDTDYHRGISLETLNRFKVGYVERWRYPLEAYLNSDKATANGKQRTKATWEKIPTSPRLIIPTSESSYLARDVRKDLTPEQEKFKKTKVGAVHMFNIGVLYSSDGPVFITEGEIDALSIIDCGAEACAIGSTSNIRRLVEMCKKKKPNAKIILAMDGDDAGKTANALLRGGLEDVGIKTVSWNLKDDGFKDANDYLVNNERGFLVSVIEEALEKAIELQEAEDYERQEYLRTSAYDNLQPLYDEINASANNPFLLTGFDYLDKVLGGGLFEGFYVLGAISSLGKTTYMAQLADQVADLNDAHVLYFTLEMSRFEMMAKSISRHTAYLSSAKTGSLSMAKTLRGIMTGRFWFSYSEEQKDLIYQAMQDYGSYARNIFHFEGIGDIGTEHIRAAIEKHIKMTGKVPLVCVDYLQIIKPEKDTLTDKQAVDRNVLELKKISRDYKLPLFTVSSFNRQNYKTEVEMASFKESGAIEYSADVLLGLQLQGAGTKDFDSTEEKSKMPRNIEMLILKNRNGAVGQTIRYEYDPRYNLFEEREIVTPYSTMKVNGQAPRSAGRMVDVPWTAAAATAEKEQMSSEDVLDALQDELNRETDQAALLEELQKKGKKSGRKGKK